MAILHRLLIVCSRRVGSWLRIIISGIRIRIILRWIGTIEISRLRV